MACRFPGADTVEAFWANLCGGVESIAFFSDAELLRAGVDPALLANPNYVKASPILSGVDMFDASFFGFSPREAAIMDPQQRLFLEVAWEAFEAAGYHPLDCEGAVGVFAGGGGVVTSYLMAQQGSPGFPGPTAGLPHLGNDKDFLSTRVSYKLNLTGPSLTVQTACSTSLVALHLGCQSLLTGESDMVLAGAVTVRIPHARGYLAEKGNVYSLDGHCRAFDAAGQGTVFGSGVAAVVLKELGRAVADGDHIYAVIKGTAVNNDGGSKASYSAPSVTGQARAMAEALRVGQISPASLGYVECHATGTAVGDPLEVEALTRAFSTSAVASRACALGSVKTNIGHPEQAAGLAGLIKTALVLRHGLIPPSLHFAAPSPAVDFERGPFYVNTALRPWPAATGPRRAAVNSLGIGGTNAFAVLEEGPPVGAPASDARPRHLLTLSAKTDAALSAYAERFRTFLGSASPASLPDVCYTANVSRSAFPRRLAVSGASPAEIAAGLEAWAPRGSGAGEGRRAGARRPVAFLFTGQGSQYPGMAEELYRVAPAFRRRLDECAEAARPHLDRPLLDVAFGRGEAGELLHETAYTQPALFAVEYALARLWEDWGIAPDAVLGHSIGELVAACVAGVFEAEAGLRLAIERGRLMQALPEAGSMAVVFAGEDTVRPIVDAAAGRLAIAAVNGPQNTVISGDRDDVAAALARFGASKMATAPLAVSHAFHSPLMDPMLDGLEAAARAIAHRPPRIPLVANVTGGVATGAPTPRYWRAHAREPVRFADGLRAVRGLGCEIFLEVGPGSALLGMGQQCLPGRELAWVPSLGRRRGGWETMLKALETLYLEGLPVRWSRVHEGAGRRRVPLPTYPFERKRYWVEGASPSRDEAPPISPAHPLLGTRTEAGTSRVRFEARYGAEPLPYLRDHRIHGRSVLPTAAALEAAAAAGQDHFRGAAFQLEGFAYHQALVLPEDGACPVRLDLTPSDRDRATFRLLSSGGRDDGEWQTHLSGVVCRIAGSAALGPPPEVAFDPRAVRARCDREIPAAAYYRALGALGLEYGASFRGIQQLWQGESTALARVRLPEGESPAAYGLHPAFLDACLHVYPAALGEADDPSRRPTADVYLPIGVEHFRVYRGGVTEGWAHAVVRNHRPPGSSPVVDINVYGTDAALVATLGGLSLRRLPAATVAPPERDESLASWLYQLRWEPRAPAPAPRAPLASWLIFADRGGVGGALAALLEERGDWCQLVFADAADAGRARSGTAPDPARDARAPAIDPARDARAPAIDPARDARAPAIDPARDARAPAIDPARDAQAPAIDPARADDFRRAVREASTAEGLPCRGAVYLWALDLAAPAEAPAGWLDRAEALGAAAPLFLAQALAEAKGSRSFAPRLWCVTRNAQAVGGAAGPPVDAAQASVWGLGRTLALEHPSLWGGLIDLPPEGSPRALAEALAEELGRSDGEGEIALRNGTRFAARLARRPAERPARPAPAFPGDATYLITGGLGMLGLAVARWLVAERGARSLVLAGRSAAAGGAADAVRALRASGAAVRVVQADVSVEADVERLLDEIRREGRPLRGIFHCAGVVDDGIARQMDAGKLARVAAPKIRGGWLLHRLTRDLPLDVFVLNSSLLSLTGSAGQANYTAANAFLDGLGAHRRALGLPATVVNWGPWGEDGMAMAAGARGAAIWRARGTRFIAPGDGLRALEHVVAHGLDQTAVTNTDWDVYLQQFAEPPTLYAELAREAGAARSARRAAVDGDIQARLRSAPPAEHRALLLDFVQAHVADELGFAEAIDPRQPLSELGLDSLMSVNVANRLEQGLGMAVPLARLIQGPSVVELVDDLFPHLARPPAGGAGPAGRPAQVDGGGATGATAAGGWLVFPRPNPEARVRLFCFHYAGGGAATFRPWADQLDPAIELVAIDPPGRGRRAAETPIDRLDAFVEQVIPAMAPYLDRPCAFFGHCLGALLLFETARRLLARGPLALERIFVSGARPPHLLQREGTFERDLLAALLRHPDFDPFLPGHAQPDAAFAEIIRRFGIDASEEFLGNPELSGLVLPAVRADFAMAAHYRHAPAPPWPVPLTCFAGQGDPYATPADALQWGHYTQVGFQLWIRQTAHFLIVDDRPFLLDAINRELAGPDPIDRRPAGNGQNGAGHHRRGSPSPAG